MLVTSLFLNTFTRFSALKMMPKCSLKWSGLVSFIRWVLYSVCSFFQLLTVCYIIYCLLFSPYLNIWYSVGRYSNASFGFLVPFKFAWITQESPSCIIPLIMLYTTASPCWTTSSVNRIFVAAIIIHYVQRSLIYPLTSRGAKPIPLAPYLSAMAFTFFNGFMQSHYLLSYQCYTEEWMKTPQFVLGMILFAVGMAINIHSDQLLIGLRKPGETGYKIPTGGLYDYVTGANFFGESLEWCGLALASCSPTSAVFAFFSTSFLGLRAYHHHSYYLKKFENYPRNRKVFIPFLF